MTVQNRVTLEEAEAGLSRLIEQMREGEEIVLLKDGVEVARIVAPVAAVTGESKPKRQGGFWAGQIREIDPDWWKPDDDLADLFEGSESRFDELLGIPPGEALKLLLDSHVLLWWSDAVPSRLSAEARETINRADEIFVSVATIWELEIKVNAGKLALTHLDWDLPAQRSVTILSIDRDDALAAARLPLLHRDPFDRMIVAQAMHRELTLMTVDRALADYGVAVLSA